VAIPFLHRVSEAAFIELILRDDVRRDFLAFLSGGSGKIAATAELVSVVAPKCEATPDQLREATRLLDAECSAEATSVLRELLQDYCD